MARYDESDCCERCGDLFSLREIVFYRDECNTDGDEMPSYCQECLDQMHVLEGSGLDVPDEMWTKDQWWRPEVRREKQGVADQG